MSAAPPGEAEFDARMRRLFAGDDTSPDFESRVRERIAAVAAAPAIELRARAERRRELLCQRLRREAWMNAVTAAGVGAAVIALVWRHGPAVASWMQEGLAAADRPGVLTGIAFAAIAAGMWPLLCRWLPR